MPEELLEFARAFAVPKDAESQRKAREKVATVPKEMLWDATGVIAFFVSITKIVDLTGHHLKDFSAL